jgi:hypothetical protein
MIDNPVIFSALKLADAAIKRAKANQKSCEAEIRAALGALDYVDAALRRDGDIHKVAKFALIDPSPDIASLADSDLAETAFCKHADGVLTALDTLRDDVCGVGTPQ